MNDKLQAVLVQLAEKLGTTAEHLWSVLIRQAKIEGVTNIVSYVILIVCICLYLKFLSPFTKVENSDPCEWSSSEFARIVTSISAGIALLVFTLAAVFSIQNTVTCFINPEFVALNNLVHMCSSIIK